MLERQNVNVKFDARLHNVIKALAARRDIGLGEVVEQLVAPLLEEKIREAVDLMRALGVESAPVSARQNPSAPVSTGQNRSASV